MVFGAFSLWLENPFMHLTVLFLAGTTAAFFGPIKYGVLPQYLKRDELIAGNALIELGTFVTILLGTMFGGFLVLEDWGRPLLAVTIAGLAVVALACSFLMPSAPGDKSIVFDWNVPRQTWKLLSYARERKDVFWSVIGASWFWFLGAAIMAQLPVFTRDVLLANDMVANVFIALFTIGIGAGSLLTNSLLKGDVSPRYVPVASIMMTVFLLDLYFAAGDMRAVLDGTSLNTVTSFFSHWQGWRVGADLFLIAFFGGIYAVPLNAIMQHRSNPSRRSRVIAANNVMNAIFMIASALAGAVLLKFMSPQAFFLLLGLANAIASVWIAFLLTQELTASIARLIFRVLYRVEVKGMENFRAAGRKAVIVANHSSFLDGPLLSAFLPERASFAINTHMAKTWWAKPVLRAVQHDPHRPHQPDGAAPAGGRAQAGPQGGDLPGGPPHGHGRADEGLRRARRHRADGEGPRAAGPHRGGTLHALLAHAGQAPPALVPQDHHHLPAAGALRSARGHARRGTAPASGRQALRRDDRHGLPHLEHRLHAVRGAARRPPHPWRAAMPCWKTSSATRRPMTASSWGASSSAAAWRR